MNLSMFDPIHALHTDAKAYPGGITALAVLIARSAGVLHNKFADSTSYEITDREADALACAIHARTGANGYIEAKCAMHGGVFVPLPEAGEAADDDVLTCILNCLRSLGNLADELIQARADGVITQDEFTAIELRDRRTIMALLSAMANLKTQVR